MDVDGLVGLLLLFGIGPGLLAFIPASIASKKGRSFGLWWLYGFFLLLVAVVHALLAEDARRVDCPHCAERIMPEASICPHCRSAVERVAPESVSLPPAEASSPLRQETTLDDTMVLRYIVQSEGDLALASDQIGADISEPVERLIEDGHLEVEDWDRVTVTAEARALLDSLEVPDLRVAPSVDDGKGGDAPADGPWWRTPDTRTFRIGPQVAYWNDEYFVLGDSAEAIELKQVESVRVDHGVADAWLIFVHSVGPETAVPIPRSALHEARQLAAALSTTLG